MAQAPRLRLAAVFLAALAAVLTLAPDAEAQRRRRRDRREDIMRLPVVNAGPTYVDFPENGQTATPRQDPGPGAPTAVPVPVPVPVEEPAPGGRRHRHGRRHRRH